MIDPHEIIRLLITQQHKCAITGLRLEILDEAHPNYMTLDTPGENEPSYTAQLVCRWIAQARKGFKRSDIERELVKFHSHRSEAHKELLDVGTLLNHFILILVRGGFCVKKTTANSIAVFKTNNGKIEQCGYIIIEEKLVVKCFAYTNDNDHHVVDLANPDYYLNVLRFFGVSESNLELGIKALVFDGIV